MRKIHGRLLCIHGCRQKKGKICICTLNRPEKKNALSEALRTEIINVLDLLRDDNHISTVIFYGGKEFFSTGFDKDEVQAAIIDPEKTEQLKNTSLLFHKKFFDTIESKQNIIITMKKPEDDIKDMYIVSPDFNGLEYLEYEDLGDKIRFIVPNLKIYDLTGKEITTLVNEMQTAGIYKINFNTSELSENLYLSTGIYFYRLSACA